MSIQILRIQIARQMWDVNESMGAAAEGDRAAGIIRWLPGLCRALPLKRCMRKRWSRFIRMRLIAVI
ncbi:MAG: hypothetical protein JXA42_24630 [Anaerolineales bacterium]|nr:hypothetical protein [Anaerolineales bacterium]